MTVKQLIEALSEIPAQDDEVAIRVSEGQSLRGLNFEIESVELTHERAEILVY